MITGFNTDIEYKGVTYHVQTEDKGLATPFILSLIYNGGTILASKRSPYDDLIKNFDEKLLTERLQKQHKLLCAAIRAGRIEDLKRMSLRDSSKKKSHAVKEVTVNQTQAVREYVKNPVQNNERAGVSQAENILDETSKTDISESFDIQISAEKNFDHSNKFPLIDAEKETNVQNTPIPENSFLQSEQFSDIFALDTNAPVPKPEIPFYGDTENLLEPDYSIALTHDDLIIDEPAFADEFVVLPSEAVEIINAAESPAIVEEDKINLEILEEIELKGGESQTLSISVTRGLLNQIIPDAHIIIKVLGSNFRPVIFHTKTDKDGIAVVQVGIPHFSRGRAALLIKATGGNYEAEIRRVIQPG